jgi:hypothetical protein
MRFTWRLKESVVSYEGWCSRIAEKDDAPGRSARSLAMAWAGPVCLAGALSHHADLLDLCIETAAVEAQTAFDSFPGGKRNHDLLLTGVTRGKAIVSIESKADEEFGQTVRQYLAGAQKKLDRGETTNARERLEGLVNALIDHRTLADDQVLDLRYQLLSGVAGAVAAAVEHGAANAVFLVHEFVTDETAVALRQRNASDLHSFGLTVFDLEFPATAEVPWCVGPLRFAGNGERLSSNVKLYVAKATTDWRTRGDT